MRAELFGSLGATGHGHGSVKAVVLGLEGEAPETTDPRAADPRLAEVRATGRLRLDGTHEIACDVDTDVVLHRRETLPFHSNGMRFTAWASAQPDEGEEPLHQREYYSVGRRVRARPGRGRRERDRARPHARCATRSPPATSCSRGARRPACRSAAS